VTSNYPKNLQLLTNPLFKSKLHEINIFWLALYRGRTASHALKCPKATSVVFAFLQTKHTAGLREFAVGHNYHLL